MPSTTAGLAVLQGPLVDVCDNDCNLVTKVSRAAAEQLIESGLADPIGKKTVKYLRLRANAPLLRASWRGGSHTTEPSRADHTCTRPEGQRLGHEFDHK